MNTICTIETASHQDGIWHVRASVVTTDAEGNEIANRFGTNQIEGSADMTDAALSSAVLALYAQED
jgi:hypothetical protein